MTKTIKFRAWYEEQSQMITTFDGNFKILVNDEDGSLLCGGEMSNGDWTEPKLMQFTGLIDKNGNEIYEGDIFKHETQSPFLKDNPIDTEFGLVQWGVWSYMYGFKENDLRFAFDRLKARQVEVVGNYYQNPELLERGQEKI